MLPPAEGISKQIWWRQPSWLPVEGGILAAREKQPIAGIFNYFDMADGSFLTPGAS